MSMEWTRGHTLGRGSTATVSKARRLGQVFAVKSVELHQSEFLQREQRILSTLKCPQIVEYKGCDVTSENGVLLYNLFMEYAPYGSIADEIRRQHSGLDEVVVGNYARQILLGLEYLHSNGIVHCDVKGRNVLVTDEGAKIADLGCARRVAEVVADSSGVIAGTPAYMAPEVARGEQQGFPADVWALGCTVLEMITGRAPWHDVSDLVCALYRIGFSGEVPGIPRFVSEQGKDFLRKCFKRNPNERWSVSELLKHGFVQESSCVFKEFDHSNSDTPTSVLDRGFWDSLEELQTTQNPNPTHTCSWDSPNPRIRIRRLCSSMPNWESDDKWVTVRGNDITENSTSSNVPEADEKTETCGSDNDLVVCYEHKTVVSIIIIGLSNCCNVNDVCCFSSNYSCCNRVSLSGCFLCIKIVPRGIFDSQNNEISCIACSLLLL